MSSGRGEFRLIEWLRERAKTDEQLVLGIGDDTAVWQPTASGQILMTADMLLEGVHFTIPPATPAEVGRKALAVNLSDIAAMAGIPLAALLTVALPRRQAVAQPGGLEFAQQVHRGLLELADEFDVALAGGDTNTWNGPLVISVTLLGEVVQPGPVRRSGAKPGDWIMVTGSLGGSLAGKHLRFQPRVFESQLLHHSAALHSMIDLSDGLAIDLHRILDASGVAAIVYEDAIPISTPAQNANDSVTPLDHALGDGEDFELLFTVEERDGQRMLNDPPTKVLLSRIGTILEGNGCEIEDSSGNRRALPPHGWEHGF